MHTELVSDFFGFRRLIRHKVGKKFDVLNMRLALGQTLCTTLSVEIHVS